MCYFIDKSRYISQLYLDLVSWLRGSPGETRAKHCKRKSPQELKETHEESRNRMAFIPCHLHEPLLSFLASPPDVSLLCALDEQVVKRFPIKRPSCADGTSLGNVTKNVVWKGGQVGDKKSNDYLSVFLWSFQSMTEVTREFIKYFLLIFSKQFRRECICNFIYLFAHQYGISKQQQKLDWINLTNCL